MAPFNQFRPRNPYDPYDNTDQLVPSDASQIRQGAVFGQFNQPLQQSPEDNANPYIDPNQNNRDYSQPPDVASQIPDAQSSEWQGPMQGPKSNWDLLQERWKGYTPSTAASDRYNSYIEHAPVRQEPSLGRRILAGAAAFSGGPQAADEIKYGGYNEAMKDYSAKLGPYQHAAELENQQNVNERAQYGNMASTALGMDKLDETARKDRETAATNQEKAEIARLRLEALDWKDKHRNWTFDFTGPTARAFNPLNPNEQVSLGPSGRFSDEDKINLKGKWGVAASAAQGQNAAGIQLEGQKLIEYNNWQRSLEDADRARRVPPQDVEKVVQANLRQRYQTDDRVRQNKWITYDESTNQYHMADASTIPPENMKEFDRLFNEIHTVNQPPYVRPQPPNMPKSMQGTPPTLPSKYGFQSQQPATGISYDSLFGPGGEQEGLTKGLPTGSPIPSNQNQSDLGNLQGINMTPQQDKGIQTGQLILIRNKAGKQFTIPPDKAQQYLESGEYERVQR